ncbi:MAG: anhydro-N-acetylmuramic acid kinase [Balneolaceae bacterium]|nr:anhydro-N-acetylmuramic acid kinase [Balneolaceae bacterium]
MNKQLTKLNQVAQKKERLILGLMSGTSLDGLDVALCRISGFGRETDIDVLNFETREYPAQMQQRLKAVQSRDSTDTRELTSLHSELGVYYAEVVLGCLKEWGVPADQIDLTGSHGQTVYHAPAEIQGEINSTLQIVDGDHIAVNTGIITISDFRQKHTAAGGEGAPLAAIFDECLFRTERNNRMLLNLGGISNFTWLPSAKSRELVTGDIGPANTLINEAMQKYFNRPFDKGGKVAQRGTVHSEMVRYVLLEPYFRKSFPKTTGQEDFRLNYIEELMKGHGIELSKEDLVASLTAITSQSISRVADQIAGDTEFEMYVSGGGVHNHAVMEDLKKRIPQATFKDPEELGISSDAKEAAMMAFFANEFVAGNGFRIPGISESKIQLGKLSFGK